MAINSIQFCFGDQSYQNEKDYFNSLERNSVCKSEENIPFISASHFIFSKNYTPVSTFEVFRLKDHPNILLFDFSTGPLSDEAFLRASDYVEKYGKKKIGKREPITKRELSYDLKLSDFTDFFNEVTDISFAEVEVRDFLIAKKIIAFNSSIGKYVTNKSEEMALITVRRRETIDDIDRFETFLHEYAHALYFVNPIFKNKISEAWKQLDGNSKKLLQAYLYLKGYQSGEESLYETELSAYAIENNYTRYAGLGNLFFSGYYYCHLKRESFVDSCRIIFSKNAPSTNYLYLSLHETYWKIFEPYLPEDIFCIANNIRIKGMVDLLLQPN